MKYILLLLFFLCLSKSSFTQDLPKNNLQELLTSNFYQEYKLSPKRKVLSIKNKGIISKLNPLTYLSAGVLFIYQRGFSEQIQAECMYQISCSNYTKFQVEKNGFRGFLLGVNQLNNCFQGIIYDCQDYQISIDSKVINPIEKINP